MQKTQKLLQGHCNQITATACSYDKRWVVTADTGDDSMLVVWDSHSGTPVRTFLNPHPNGVRCMDLSKDNQYIVTIGAETEDQTVSLWDWTNEQETGPIVSMQIRAGLSQSNPMHWIKFNPDDPFEIATNSGKRLLFLSWSLGVSKFEYYSPSISKGDYNSKGSYNAAYTKTVFIPGTEMAVTGTESGDILVFDRSLIIEGIGEQNEKRIIKIVTLNQKQTPIT